jgi:hydrogenase small subunit
MNSVNRRTFLTVGARCAALFGLGRAAAPGMAEAVEQLASGTAPVLWLQGLSCSGCSVSLLNSDPLTPDLLLTRYISLAFHQTLSAATGHTAVDAVNRLIEKGDYVLVVEGAVPMGLPKACTFGEELFTHQLGRAARAARLIVTVGTCASFGGIPGSAQNPTGAVPVSKFLAAEKIDKPWVIVPGCPAHPDWTVGTLAHALKFGLPPLDEEHRPKAFYSRLVHERCPRFADYERENFARRFGEDGCLFKLGCAGPITHADCPTRLWNSGTNFCINAGAPCVGCAGRNFAAQAGYPLLVKSDSTPKSGAA